MPKFLFKFEATSFQWTQCCRQCYLTQSHTTFGAVCHKSVFSHPTWESNI